MNTNTNRFAIGSAVTRKSDGAKGFVVETYITKSNKMMLNVRYRTGELKYQWTYDLYLDNADYSFMNSSND